MKAVGEVQIVRLPFSSSRLTVIASAVTCTRSARRAARALALRPSQTPNTSRPRNGSTTGACSTTRNTAIIRLKTITTPSTTFMPRSLSERFGVIRAFM